MHGARALVRLSARRARTCKSIHKVRIFSSQALCIISFQRTLRANAMQTIVNDTLDFFHTLDRFGNGMSATNELTHAGVGELIACNERDETHRSSM